MEVRPLDLAPPGPGEVEVRVEASGVCGSDLHQLLGEYDLPLPCVPGHEAAGVVTRTGPGVQEPAVGQRVVLLWRVSCGRCAHCLDGRPALCDLGSEVRHRGVMPDGRSRMSLDGRPIHHFIGVSAFAEYAVVRAEAAVPVRDDVPAHVAALVGCAVVTGLGAAWNAGGVRPGRSVAVFGCGGVGLNVIHGAAIAGAHPIVAVDAEPAKRDLAHAFGATHFVAADRAAPLAAAREATALTGGRGADTCFEAVGRPELIEAAIQATRKGGRTVLVGIAPVGARAAFDPAQLVLQEKTVCGSVYGSCVPRREIPRILDLYAAGRLRLDALVTARYPLGRINEAVAEMRSGRAARVLIDNQG